MTYNNHLAFNISKSTPTTSTTNENTTSKPPTSNEAPPNSSGNSTWNTKSPFMLNILSKSSTKTGSVTPTTVTIGDDSSHGKHVNSSEDNPGNGNKSDLIGLFDKFDIRNKDNNDIQGGDEADDDSDKDHESHDEKLANKEIRKEVSTEDELVKEEHAQEEPTKDEHNQETIRKDTHVEETSIIDLSIREASTKEEPKKSTVNGTPVGGSVNASLADESAKVEPIQQKPKTNAIQNDQLEYEIPNKNDTTKDVTSEESFEENAEKKKVSSGNQGTSVNASLINSKDNKESLMSMQAYEPLSPNSKRVTTQANPEPPANDQENEIFDEKGDDPRDERDLSDITGNTYDEESAVEEYNLLENETSLESNYILDSNAEDKTTPPERSRNNTIESHKSGRSKKTQPFVNPEEQYQQSHKPFDFQNFLVHLKKKSADPIVRYIRSFLVSFSRQGHTFTSEQKIKIIRDFKNFMSDKFSLYEPFASMDDIDLENSREGLEKLIMNRLYEHCFAPEVASQSPNFLSESTKEDLKEDEEFYIQLEKFSWINGPHLDIDLDYLMKIKSKANKDDLNFIDYAITELNKINNYRAPRDKIICILNACKIIFSFLRVSNQETNADSFIPLLILVIIKAKTDNLISNMHYIENYRNEEWLSHGETSYYLSSLQGAINFIQNLGVDDLTIDENEYNAHMEAWKAEEKQRTIVQKPIATPIPRRQESELEQPHPQHASTAQQSLSPSNVLLTSAEMFTKSLSNFLSPSPQNSPESQPPPQAETSSLGQRKTSQEDSKKMKETYKNLREVFPNLDNDVLKDVVVMNKGDLDESLDACLQLVNDV